MWANFGRKRTEVAKSGPKLENSGPKSAKSVTRFGPNLAYIGANSVESAQTPNRVTRPDPGQVPTRRVDHTLLRPFRSLDRRERPT